MTIEAIPGLTSFLPTLPGLPLMNTRALTPMATTVITRPVAVTLMVAFTGGLVASAVGVGVGFTVGEGVGVGLTVELGEGDGDAFALTVTGA